MQTAELVDPGMEPAPAAEAPEIKRGPFDSERERRLGGGRSKSCCPVGIGW